MLSSMQNWWSLLIKLSIGWNFLCHPWIFVYFCLIASVWWTISWFIEVYHVYTQDALPWRLLRHLVLHKYAIQGTENSFFLLAGDQLNKPSFFWDHFLCMSNCLLITNRYDCSVYSYIGKIKSILIFYPNNSMYLA